jgi:phenylalanyl-tRNA synthetase alpha chain
LFSIREGSPKGERNVAYTVPKLKDFSSAALDQAVEKLLCALKEESAVLGDSNDRKLFRDRWLARKDGILSQVNDLWLKAAPKEAKRDVGQRVNKLKAEVESKVEAAIAARSALSTRSSARRTRSSPYFATWAIPLPKAR